MKAKNESDLDIIKRVEKKVLRDWREALEFLYSQLSLEIEGKAVKAQEVIKLSKALKILERREQGETVDASSEVQSILRIVKSYKVVSEHLYKKYGEEKRLVEKEKSGAPTLKVQHPFRVVGVAAKFFSKLQLNSISSDEEGLFEEIQEKGVCAITLVGLLHDVVEDKFKKDFEKAKPELRTLLGDAGLSEGEITEVLDAVEVMTRRPGETYEEYIDRPVDEDDPSVHNDLATFIKLCDILQNAESKHSEKTVSKAGIQIKFIKEFFPSIRKFIPKEIKENIKKANPYFWEMLEKIGKEGDEKVKQATNNRRTRVKNVLGSSPRSRSKKPSSPSGSPE